MTELWCWRHPRAKHTAGRCIGRSDVPVDPRKAKRLAHRIRQQARHHRLPHRLWVSPLARSQAVGGWLARWGWQVQCAPLLAEMDFGDWDGLPWTAVAWDAVQAWQDDLLHHRPGGGESLALLAQRVRTFVAQRAGDGAGPCLLVGHGGWINALFEVPPGCQFVAAAHWPAPPRHGELRRWPPPL